MSGARSSRGNPSMSDVVRSVAVLGAIVVAIWFAGRFFTNTPEAPVREIDLAQVVSQARPAASFPLLAPARLPAGWRATSARFERNSWHVGVLTDDDQYLGLEQVTVSRDRAVTLFADESRLVGDAVVAGATWTERSGPRGRHTFVRAQDGVTILVTGSASRETVVDYIASLSSS